MPIQPHHQCKMLPPHVSVPSPSPPPPPRTPGSPHLLAPDLTFTAFVSVENLGGNCPHLERGIGSRPLFSPTCTPIRPCGAARNDAPLLAPGNTSAGSLGAPFLALSGIPLPLPSRLPFPHSPSWLPSPLPSPSPCPPVASERSTYRPVVGHPLDADDAHQLAMVRVDQHPVWSRQVASVPRSLASPLRAPQVDYGAASLAATPPLRRCSTLAPLAGVRRSGRRDRPSALESSGLLAPLSIYCFPLIIVFSLVQQPDGGHATPLLRPDSRVASQAGASRPDMLCSAAGDSQKRKKRTVPPSAPA